MKTTLMTFASIVSLILFVVTLSVPVAAASPEIEVVLRPLDCRAIRPNVTLPFLIRFLQRQPAKFVGAWVVKTPKTWLIAKEEAEG